MDAQLEKLIKERDVILIMRFGSHLYGTDTPKSDTDYKGIFIPTKEEILLQKAPKSINITPKKGEQGIKNGAGYVDIELYSLQYFIKLCLKGETVGVDMLHCNKKNIIYQNGKLWDFIQSERSKFYSKSLSVLVSYCRKQAAKYGCKGSRIADARNVLNFLDSFEPEYQKSQKMEMIWDQLPEGEHIKFVVGDERYSGKADEFYQVCGKKMQKTSKIQYCAIQMEAFIAKYGHRALLAEKNEGLDWKAISHAMRYALQLKELFETGDIKFPLAEKDALLKIKLGELDYKSDVAPALDKVIEEVEALALKSVLPQKSDSKYWINFIRDYYESVIKV